MSVMGREAVYTRLMPQAVMTASCTAPLSARVEAHVPAECVERLALAAPTCLKTRSVGDVVGEHVPVTRRGLGLGSVGPELWIGRMTLTIVQAKAIVAVVAGGDVDLR